VIIIVSKNWPLFARRLSVFCSFEQELGKLRFPDRKNNFGYQIVVIINNTQSLLAVLMGMPMHRCNAKHTAQLSTTRASLGATGYCHWASTRTVLPQQLPWSLMVLTQQTQKKLLVP
jgi:hypothetical protein